MVGDDIMVKMVSIKDVKQGMVVGKDIFTETSGQIIAGMTVLSPRAIKRLELYSIKEVPIYFEDEELQKEIEDRASDMKQYTEAQRTRQSKEFKAFKKAFGESTKVAERVLNDIAMQEGKVNRELLNTMIDRVVEVSNNGLYVFDMLHCMRELDDLTYAHSMSVALICKVFGEWLHMPKEDIEVLKMAGFLHDIGKVKIPSDIITKKAALTQSEYETIKKHTNLGYEILKSQNIDERIKRAALCHHERIDGTGYPLGLKGEEIDEFSKIVAIADTYEAMTAKRCYRDPICPFKVVEEMQQLEYDKYDAKYMIPLLEMIVQSYIGNNVMLSNDQDGKVVMLNRNDLARPIVKINDSYVDLSKERSLYIDAII